MFAVTLCIGTPMNTMLVLFPLLMGDTGTAAAAAGVLSGVAIIATVAAELATPVLFARWSAGRILSGAFLLSGLGGMALALAPSLVELLPAGAALGAGFGLGVAVTGALPAAIEQQRGRGLAFGVFAMGSSLPSVVGPPIALLLLPSLGLRAVVALCGVLAVAGLLWTGPVGRSLIACPRVAPAAVSPRISGQLSSSLLAYGSITLAFGGVITFTVRYLDGSDSFSVAGFFLLLGISRMISRSLAARLADGVGVTRLQAWSLLTSCLGLVLLAIGGGMIGGGILVAAAAVLYGAGFGATQTTSLIAATSGRSSMTSGSVLWCVTSDAGMGIGALALAPVGALLGYGWLFAILPIVTLAGFLVHTFGARVHQARKEIPAT
jgi:predicted MFS family arabinose efflux permease